MLKPIGFWSYCATDDENSRGKLSQLRALLASELQQRFGRTKVNIFQDVSAIPPGSEWERKIRDSLHDASFLIPILTPAFFQSEWCCKEVLIFRERELRLGRSDLIFPLQYIDTSHIDPKNADECSSSEVFALLAARQRSDFQPLRLKDFARDEAVSEALSELAVGIWGTLRSRLQAAESEPVALAAEAPLREAPHAATPGAAQANAHLSSAGDKFADGPTVSARSPRRRWFAWASAGLAIPLIGGLAWFGQAHFDAVVSLDRQYRAEVLPFCRTVTVGRYPFENVKDDVSIDDFTRLFRRDGVLGKFYKDRLASLIDTSTNNWQWKKSDPVAAKFSDDALRQFRRWSEIERSFFVESDQAPNISYRVTALTPVAEGTTVALQFGKLRVVSPQSRVGSRKVAVGTPDESVWPDKSAEEVVLLATSESVGATFTLMTIKGVWGLFRLLDRASAANTANGIGATLAVAGREFRYRIDVRRTNPFLSPELREFRCPESLIAAGA